MKCDTSGKRVAGYNYTDRLAVRPAADDSCGTDNLCPTRQRLNLPNVVTAILAI